MPVMPDQSNDVSLSVALQSYCKHDLYTVSRIDRPVSGLVVMAKNKKAAAHLSHQFSQGKVRKEYFVIVEGKMASTNDVLVHFMVRGKNRKSVVVDEQDALAKNAKRAELSYKKIIDFDHYTGLVVYPVTGRFHQIRAQFAAIGHPVKGDIKYGARRKNKDRSIYLFAHGLTFYHPVTGEKCQYSVLPGGDDVLWKLFLSKLKDNNNE